MSYTVVCTLHVSCMTDLCVLLVSSCGELLRCVYVGNVLLLLLDVCLVTSVLSLRTCSRKEKESSCVASCCQHCLKAKDLFNADME